MPEMILGKMPTKAMHCDGCRKLAASRVILRVLAYMNFPRDEVVRRSFLAQSYAHLFWSCVAEPPRDFIDAANEAFYWNRVVPRIRKHARREFEAAGGLDALFDTSLMVIDEQGRLNWHAGGQWRTKISEPAWRTAATIARVMQAIEEFHPDFRGGASVNKAAYVIEGLGPSEGFPGNRATILAQWAEFKPVAHLCCAYFDLELDSSSDAGESKWGWQEAPLLLATAGRYQDFLTTHRAKRGRATPVAKDELWLVPSSAEPWGEAASTISPNHPLSPKQLDLLKQYRPPKAL